MPLPSSDCHNFSHIKVGMRERGEQKAAAASDAAVLSPGQHLRGDGANWTNSRTRRGNTSDSVLQHMIINPMLKVSAD